MTQPLSAIGDNGQPVDWWFIYKVPKNARPASVVGHTGAGATGYEYVYYDAQSTALAPSQHCLNEPSNALSATLCQLVDDTADSAGWIFYNDEYPLELHKVNAGSKGHTKGVLAFDLATNSAFWLLHSVPRFPLPGTDAFPVNELDYGQTFLCVTLKDVATAEMIAQQMLAQQGPQTYGARLPQSLDVASVWRALAADKLSLLATPTDITFSSLGGRMFRSIAKSRLWGKDLWTDLVGPNLGVDLDVESWRRGAIPGNEDSDNRDWVADDISIDLEPLGAPYFWQNAKDHAKWALSVEDNDDWVCVADINRQTSQAKRGGGTICFQESRLWANLSQIVKCNPPDNSQAQG
ncbi:MAG TPA: deoxyribonuclease II family protein [Chloroflexia bacterium]|nr:deoxyribonuclease II family protein [Chloroflexia bacterium]